MAVPPHAAASPVETPGHGLGGGGGQEVPPGGIFAKIAHNFGAASYWCQAAAPRARPAMIKSRPIRKIPGRMIVQPTPARFGTGPERARLHNRGGNRIERNALP